MLLGHIAVLSMQMRQIVTDWVSWSVCHTSEPCKKAEPIKMQFVFRTRVGQRNHVLDGGPLISWSPLLFIFNSLFCYFTFILA